MDKIDFMGNCNQVLKHGVLGEAGEHGENRVLT